LPNSFVFKTRHDACNISKVVSGEKMEKCVTLFTSCHLISNFSAGKCENSFCIKTDTVVTEEASPVRLQRLLEDHPEDEL